MSNRFWKNAVAGFSVAVVVSIICGIAIMKYREFEQAMEAEKTLHAYHLVMDVVTEFVRANEGQWPKNWDELKDSRPRQAHSIWSWPDDAAAISERVVVDFASPPEGDDVTSFDAIRQWGPNYGPEEIWIEALLSAIHRENDRRGRSN